VQLRDQVNRLQIQLNHGHSGFSEFKEKKAAEIRGLQNEIQKLKEQVNVSITSDVVKYIIFSCFIRQV